MTLPCTPMVPVASATRSKSMVTIGPLPAIGLLLIRAKCTRPATPVFAASMAPLLRLPCTTRGLERSELSKLTLMSKPAGASRLLASRVKEASPARMTEIEAAANAERGMLTRKDRIIIWTMAVRLSLSMQAPQK